ncbi:MAG: hypothetical protein FWD26_08690 [Treponema sp.]|nr:hypothetical protein [Treponema sp.]
MKKTKFSLLVLMPILASIMLLILSSCDGSYMDPGILGEAGSLGGISGGTIIVRNDSTYSSDANVTVSVRYANNTSNVLASGNCARNNSITLFNIPAGTYIVQVTDGNSWSANSSSFTISESQTEIFNYNGFSLTRL